MPAHCSSEEETKTGILSQYVQNFESSSLYFGLESSQVDRVWGTYHSLSMNSDVGLDNESKESLLSRHGFMREKMLYAEVM